MKSLEYLTALVLARRSLCLPPGEEAILWADLLLAQGCESAEVKTLAQHSSTATKAQIEKQVDVCFSKLGLELVDEKFAHILLIWAWAQKLLKAKTDVREFLDTMRQSCVNFEHEPVYMPFYLLHCAQKDLGKSGIVFHDRELNEQNFEQVLHWEMDLFLDQNERNVLDKIKIDR